MEENPIQLQRILREENGKNFEDHNSWMKSCQVKGMKLLKRNEFYDHPITFRINNDVCLLSCSLGIETPVITPYNPHLVFKHNRSYSHKQV